MTYDNQKEAISKIFSIKISDIKKKNGFGLENDGIYQYKDRIFKLTSSKREFSAAKRLVGKDFKNVVKVYSSNLCNIYNEQTDSIWKTYIIEEEKLNRNGANFLFNDLNLHTLCINVEKRLPFFVGIMNGLVELASVGIIYYDIHSMNIMFGNSNQVKIIDFGCVSVKRKYMPIESRINITN